MEGEGILIHILRWVLEKSTKDFRYYSKMIWLPKITCIWPYESCKGSGQINIYWLNGESRQTCPKMKMFRKKSSHVALKGGRPSPSGTFSIVWLWKKHISYIQKYIYIYTHVYIYAYICMMHVCIVYWSPNALLVSTSTCQKFHSTFQCLSRSFCICGNLEATPTCTMIHHQPMVKVGGCGSGGSACSKRQHNPFPLRILRIGSSNLHHQWILDRNQVSEILLKKTSMFHQSRMKTHLPR